MCVPRRGRLRGALKPRAVGRLPGSDAGHRLEAQQLLADPQDIPVEESGLGLNAQEDAVDGADVFDLDSTPFGVERGVLGREIEVLREERAPTLTAHPQLFAADVDRAVLVAVDVEPHESCHHPIPVVRRWRVFGHGDLPRLFLARRRRKGGGERVGQEGRARSRRHRRRPGPAVPAKRAARIQRLAAVSTCGIGGGFDELLTAFQAK